MEDDPKIHGEIEHLKVERLDTGEEVFDTGIAIEGLQNVAKAFRAADGTIDMAEDFSWSDEEADRELRELLAEENRRDGGSSS